MGKIHRRTETDLGGGRGHRDTRKDAERGLRQVMAETEYKRVRLKQSFSGQR
jgi:hypothetical protein